MKIKTNRCNQISSKKSLKKLSISLSKKQLYNNTLKRSNSKAQNIIHLKQNRKQNAYTQLLYWETKFYFSRVNSNIQSVQQTIKKVVFAKLPKNKKIRSKLQGSENKLYIESYKRGIGWICAHVSYHYKQYSLDAILKILELNLERNVQNKPQVMFQIVISSYQVYLQSLLFEFIPIQYSQFLLQLYLHEFQATISRVKSTDPRPFQFYKLICSLIHYILIIKDPVSINHVEQLCLSCYMGTVEWPIIIANRDLFDCNKTGI